jgi:hypothetical protein
MHQLWDYHIAGDDEDEEEEDDEEDDEDDDEDDDDDEEEEDGAENAGATMADLMSGKVRFYTVACIT